MLDSEITYEGAVLGEGELAVLLSDGRDGLAELSGFQADGEDERERIFGKR